MSDFVRILLPDTGRGLQRDASLAATIVEEAGYRSEIETVPIQSERVIRWLDSLDRWKAKRLSGRLLYAVNRLLLRVCSLARRSQPILTVHIQRIQLRYLGNSGEHWLIPNQEWFQTSKQQYLGFYDRVLCKTREAHRAFSSVVPNASYIGFSGSLPAPPDHRKDWSRWLHVAGNNRKKGSAAVVRVWARHPEWPVLDLVIEDRNRLPVIPSNARIHERINDADLESLRQRCGMVLAPSEAEGFGHVLFDAMAYGQVVVTVDAPPMNELVGKDRGFLVGWSESSPCRMGTQYFIDDQALEETIENILSMDGGALQDKSREARAWVESNDEGFRERMHVIMEELKRGK